MDKVSIAGEMGYSPSWVTKTVKSFDHEGLWSFYPTGGRPSSKSPRARKCSLDEVEDVFDAAYDRVFGRENQSEERAPNQPRKLMEDALLRRILKWWVLLPLRPESANLATRSPGKEMRERAKLRGYI